MYILIVSTQQPYYGGSATFAYHTITYLRDKGHIVDGIFLNTKGTANIDPDNIGNIYKVDKIRLFPDEYFLKLPEKPQTFFQPLLKLLGHIITEKKVIEWINEFYIESTEITQLSRKKKLPNDFLTFIKINNINWKTAFDWLYNRKLEYEKDKKMTNLLGLSFSEKYKDHKKFKRDYDVIHLIKGGDWSPDIIFAFNYEAPIICKNLFPKVPIYFVVVGNPELSLGINSLTSMEISAQKFIRSIDNYTISDLPCNNIVKEACKNSDKILISSNITWRLMNILHSDAKEKFISIDMYFPIYSLKYKTNIELEKEYDIICIASSWKRSVKNLAFCENIYMKFPNLKKIIIGGFAENSNNGNKQGCDHFTKIENTTVLPLIEHKIVIEYIKKSRILLIPSFYESYSLIVLEAVYNNCKILTSRNVGSSDLLPSSLVCNDVYDENEWIDNINILLQRDFNLKEVINERYESNNNILNLLF